MSKQKEKPAAPKHGEATEMKKKFRWWLIPIIAVATVFAVVVVYVSYVFISYSRIDDNLTIEVKPSASSASVVKTDTEYTAMSYNIGFGAYTPDFTFFMDGGSQSWANSKESVIDCINGDIELIKQYKVDFPILQEVDTDSTRSYHVDQATMIRDAFDAYSSAFAVNYHSAFLFYPIFQPHGASNSGLLTMSCAEIDSALRRSLPISNGLKKFLDLDRCYSISRVKVENGKELVIINVHLSAYGTDGDIQQQQLTMLFSDMQAEYEKGNYVICAGDYNHDFLGNSKELLNKSVGEEIESLAWAATFPDELIPAGFAKVTDYASATLVPSCRNCDVPYGPDCFTVILDGFIVSDNIETTYVDIIDNQFRYSDHNPVVLKFKLSGTAAAPAVE